MNAIESFLPKVLECVREVAPRAERERINEDSPLFEILDSFHLVQLIICLEKNLAVEFGRTELFTRAHWASPRKIAELMLRRQRQEPS